MKRLCFILLFVLLPNVANAAAYCSGTLSYVLSYSDGQVSRSARANMLVVVRPAELGRERQRVRDRILPDPSAVGVRNASNLRKFAGAWLCIERIEPVSRRALNSP